VHDGRFVDSNPSQISTDVSRKCNRKERERRDLSNLPALHL